MPDDKDLPGDEEFEELGDEEDKNFPLKKHIDVYELDRCAVEQVDLYHIWGERLARAERTKQSCIEELAYEKAKLSVKIREDPEKYGWDLEKEPTEPWVKEQIILDDNIRALAKNVIQATYQYNMINNARKEVLEHRRKSLDILTELYKGDYWGGRSKWSPAADIARENGKREQTEMLNADPDLKQRLTKKGQPE
jgi:hypothetical protein